MTTALQIITRALDEIGVGQDGQTLSASDSSKCLLALNTLVDAWLTAPNNAYTSQKVTATLNSGVPYLTIGPAMSLDCARPVRIEDGCYVTIGVVDYPIRQINRAEYLGISLKALTGPWPGVFYYEAGSPTGLVYFWPTGNCTVTMSVLTQLGAFADLTTDYTLPPGYERAYALTLAEEVAPTFRVTVDNATVRNAKAARRDLKRSNLIVPELVADPGLHVRNMPIVSTTNYDGVDGNS